VYYVQNNVKYFDLLVGINNSLDRQWLGLLEINEYLLWTKCDFSDIFNTIVFIKSNNNIGRKLCI